MFDPLRAVLLKEKTNGAFRHGFFCGKLDVHSNLDVAFFVEMNVVIRL